MNHKELLEYFIEIAGENYPDGLEEVELPPPVFVSMGAEFIEINREKGIMTVRFPVPESSLNPFGNMQGGMIAAAVDNTIGPLSMIAAGMNFTRKLELTYRKVVRGSFDYIDVTAEFTGRQRRKLFFSAEVRDPEGTVLAEARAMNWIVA